MENQQPKKQRIKFFNILPLDKVNKKASDTPKRARQTYNKTTIEKKVSTLKSNKVNTTIYDSVLQANDSNNTIQAFLNECHPDVRKFIEVNEWAKIVATASDLIVTTRNRFIITIGNISKYSKQINIKDNKGKLIFNGVQTVGFKQAA